MVRTVDLYGAPSYGPLGRPIAGLIFHTPENVDPTLAQAIAVAKWQASSGNKSGGSYHGILGHDSAKYPHSYMLSCDDPEHWVMVRSVPWNTAAGGVTTNRDPSIWRPDRFPWIKQLVHAQAYADPNRFFHQIALSGKAAQYVQNGYPKGALIAVAQWVKILEKAYKYDAVLTLHRMWQTNRSDPGPLDFADLVLKEYRKLDAPAPDPVTPPPPPPEPEPEPVNPLQAVVDSKNKKIDQAIALLQDARND